MTYITESQFRQSFLAIALRGRSFPKKDLDRHVLLYSAILQLDANRTYSEREINDHLVEWTMAFGEVMGLDHVTLRRFLIDARYLMRNPAGTAYEINATDFPFEHEPSIVQLDLQQVVEDARREHAERKQRYLGTAKE